MWFPINRTNNKEGQEIATQVQIINLALTKIGASPITSLEEGSNQARTAVTAWELARRALLRAHPWNFAIADVELSRVNGVTNFDFKYTFQLPSNNVRVIRVYGNPDYKVQGRRLLSNEDSCKVRYVFDQLDTAEWDASFVDLMAHRLASDMAYAITKSQSTADSCAAIFEQKLRQAKHIDATEDVQDMLGGTASLYLGSRF